MISPYNPFLIQLEKINKNHMIGVSSFSSNLIRGYFNLGFWNLAFYGRH
jgi:hypothetical protein